MDKVEQQRAHFESISEYYFEQRQNKNHLLLKDLIWQEFFKDKSYLKNDDFKILEPMCGYAEGKKILEKYLDLTGEYTGFDYSDTLIEKVKQQDPDLNVYVQDITTYSPQDTYDIMILIGGLHHVYRHTEHVIQLLNKALKPGGYLINFEPTHDNPLYAYVRKQIYNKNDLFDEDTEEGFPLKSLNGFFQQNGFEIKDQIYPGLLSYIMYYNPDAFPALNIGGTRMVKSVFALDKLFMRNWIGRKFSWATLTLWQKTSECQIDQAHTEDHKAVA